MSFSDLPEHLQLPALRQFQAFPIKKDGQQYIALRDHYALVNETMVVPPNIFAVIQRINGNTPAKDIADVAKAPPEQFIKLLQKLDNSGLLWGPTSTALENKKIEELNTNGSFPIKASGTLGKDKEKCKAQLAHWFSQTEDPEFSTEVKAIIAPHLDYGRGWPNYASAYYAWQNTKAPDRVVVLGTNHFGEGDGVVISTIGFNTPIGTCPIDEKIVGAIVDKFGNGITRDLIDHAAEHSIELQIPWIQQCFGSVPIVAALIPSPLMEMLEDDGDNVRTKTDQFIPFLKEILQKFGGKTLVVASADLSHVGQQFGEPRPVDEQRKFDVERHDREMMTKYITNDCEEFISAMKWHNNSTHWCSIGNMSAALNLVEPDEIELIDYRQACDDKGIALVSSCAIALL